MFDKMLEIFMLGLKSSGPVIKQRSKPEVLISKVVNRQSDLLLHQRMHLECDRKVWVQLDK